MSSGRIFAIGDLHLSFSSDKPMAVFGTEWENHHDKIEKNWRNKIAEEDTVFVLGDTSWALKLENAIPDLEWLHRLPGRKVLLRGNHDLWWNSISRLRALYDNVSFVQNDCFLSGDTALCGNRGWTTPGDTNFSEAEDRKIYERELLRLRLALDAAKQSGAAEIIVGMHYPPAMRGRRSGFTEIIEEYAPAKVVYGHLHGNDAFGKGIIGKIGNTEYILASADYIKFNPIIIKEE